MFNVNQVLGIVVIAATGALIYRIGMGTGCVAQLKKDQDKIDIADKIIEHYKEKLEEALED